MRRDLLSEATRSGLGFCSVMGCLIRTSSSGGVRSGSLSLFVAVVSVPIRTVVIFDCLNFGVRMVPVSRFVYTTLCFSLLWLNAPGTLGTPLPLHSARTNTT